MSSASQRLTGASILAIIAVCGLVAPRPADRALATQSAATATVENRVSADELMRVVTELASPRYEGRGSGTNGGRAARAFVRNAFADLGLVPAAASGFEQPFRLPRPSSQANDAANVVGTVQGTTGIARTIVITAHYDHLGVRNGLIYPGADDNASGVAALLALARYTKGHPLRHPVLFVAFDAEELGLQGAKAFLSRPLTPVRDIALNVNLDMVSRSDRNEIFAAGPSYHPWLKTAIDDVRRRAAVRILYGHDRPDGRAGRADDWTMQSDHGAFHEAGVPFVYFGVENHPDYHRPTDTADKINPTFFRNAVEAVLEAVIALDREMDRTGARDSK